MSGRRDVQPSVLDSAATESPTLPSMEERSELALAALGGGRGFFLS